MSQPPYAKVTAHRGILICELLVDGDVPGAVASTINNPGRFGQVIMNTPANLAVSEEALKLLRTIPAGRDAIGDVDWFSTNNTAAFGWIGGPNALVSAEGAVGARGYIGSSMSLEQLKRLCMVVPNEPPATAVEAIDTPS